jgi:hypothetical protein
LVTAKEEAEMIVSILFDKFGSIGVVPPTLPPFVDGRKAIKWLRDQNLPYGEVEWPGYYIKHYTRFLLDVHLPNQFEHFNPKPKLNLIRGKYIWDIRLKSTKTRSSWVILTDTSFLDDFIDEHGGLGLLVALAYPEYDKDGSFRRWHEDFKGGVSQYTLQRIAEGRPARMRKSAFMIVYISAYHLNRKSFHDGIEQGWVDPSFQRTMRQQDGSSRNPKYCINLEGIYPEKGYLFTWNFNHDPEDFDDIFHEEG